MNLCDDNHDEVCYECKECPVCEKMRDIENLEENISELVDNIQSLKDELAESKAEGRGE